MIDAINGVVIVALYLVAGRLLYKIRWPDGFVPPAEDDAELERTRRVGRRRVQPVPRRDRRQGP